MRPSVKEVIMGLGLSVACSANTLKIDGKVDSYKMSGLQEDQVGMVVEEAAARIEKCIEEAERETNVEIRVFDEVEEDNDLKMDKKDGDCEEGDYKIMKSSGDDLGDCVSIF